MALEMQSTEQGNERFIKGEWLHTIFQNEAEQFAIAKIRVIETNEDINEKDIVVKGYIAGLQPGETYMFFGRLITHAKFGMQYQVERYQTFIPDTEEGLAEYLASDLFFGVGLKTAQKIIRHLGMNAIEKILQNEDVLKEVPGLGEDTARGLARTLRENQGFERVVIYLSKHDIGLKLAQKIYKQYREEAVELLDKDPYRFVYDIEGFGFQTADNIARQNGLAADHPNRIGAGCMFVLQKSSSEGHVYLPLDECTERILELLQTPDLTSEKIIEQLRRLNAEKTVIIQEERCYLPSLYYAEDRFCSHMERIMREELEFSLPDAELLQMIGDIEETEVLSYGKEQFNAIEKALHSKVMILTGGPGTGKTTVVKGILKAYAAAHELELDPEYYETKEEYPFILCAPTGRAAKRLQESTGLPATTIHRLLGWDGHSGFGKDQDEPLSGKLLIIDEFSMVDIWLAHNLFRAIPKDMQVLLVGDEDQLPSVGPGQVLTDLLQSEMIPAVTLDEVYRQKEGSKIIQLAHEIKHDTLTPQSLANAKDFSFIPCREGDVVSVVTQVFQRAVAKGMDTRDLQVLAPIYRSQAGINIINKTLQELINPPAEKKREVKFMEVIFRIGDKVLQLVNQPEDGVYNGDIGEIVAIFRANENTEKKEQIVVAFDDKEVVYERPDYGNLMHAYCISIHKSQGSEFPNVILPVAFSYTRMLKKNLLYTAITRSKQTLIICGESEAFMRGIRTIDTNSRYTSLKEKLLIRFGKEESSAVVAAEGELIATVELEDGTEMEILDEDPSLSPYDFM
ncbi:ATP-dependent RecD-like DNA helicase [Aciduricibacillus chroicocephali]|uniref:ATP-dependent RecD2 DNA helicase n=1 Tax=Aciduricibacillus chroicocephali TaxID=3054939 RepID=A0ABY9KSB6_9BACI|nr:ATP-dependent RecD-like DNA helicase [Bacillaceae bacterium 44XB]